MNDNSYINTNGGSIIAGNVDTNRDFVGRDQINTTVNIYLARSNQEATSKEPINTKVVRDLLLASLASDDFDEFCYDNFPIVHVKFSTTLQHTQKVQLLIDHCFRYGHIERLFTLIREINPYQFHQHFS